MPRRLGVALTVIGVLVAAGWSAVAFGRETYEIKISMPTATGIFDGADVVMAGESVGEVTDVAVKDNMALISVEVDDADSPLHAGTWARITWQSLLGFRVLELIPGPERNPILPSGQLVRSSTERVEVDDLLAMLDGPTRDDIQGLVKQLNQTLEGRERDVHETLKAAGPTVQALGEVMRAVGEDGPAVRDLVTRLHAMTRQLAIRDTELAETVHHVGDLTSSAAGQERALKAALAELPSTVRAARITLDRVPAAVRATDPLLKDLRPAATKLPQVARSLSPVLRDLQPTAADMKPMLASVNSLLHRTPRLLASAHHVLPHATEGVTRLRPAVAFLRPYTPELSGWLANWTSVFASQSSGNYGRALIVEGGSTFNDNPGIMPPGVEQADRPAPGSIAGQPWTDAYGDGLN